MQITHPHTLFILAWLAIGQLCTGCSAEDIAGEQSNTGVLCLQMSSDEVFIETRAEQTLTDWSGYSFTLNNKPITFNNKGEAIVPAGTDYTLSATNSEAVGGGYSGPLYSGSTEFTLNAGEHKTIELDLGKPKNAKVTVELSKVFTELYTLVNLTLTDGTSYAHTITPEKTDKVVYFPATETTLSYTLVADANLNSHVQDITNATGTVTIAPGMHTPLTLDVNPIDPDLVIITTGPPHSGEFQ